MGIEEKEEDLFGRWRMKDDPTAFVKDGVVCEEEYLSAQPKIVLVLKEVNDRRDGGGWDLRRFVFEARRPQTWNNVARWVHGIGEVWQKRVVPGWKEYGEAKAVEELRKSVLKRICVMNLKKWPGGSATNAEELEAAVKRDGDFVRQQYQLYDADITICGGTGEKFKAVIDPGKKNDWKRTSRGIWYFENAMGKPVFAYAHPEVRVQDCLVVYGLLDAVREVVGNRSE